MKNFTLLILFAFIFSYQSTYACSCIGPSSFCESISDADGNIFAEVILRGTITKSSSEGEEIQVDQLLYGDLSQSEIVLKFGLCDLYFGNLEEGGEYIFALSTYSGDYSLIPCAISFLEIENGVVKGKIAPGVESINYFDLVTLEGCGANFKLFSIERNMSIFPNPTNDILKIKNMSPADSVQNIQVAFFDMLGRELYTFKKEDGIFAGEIWALDLQNFSAGVYFLKLTADNQERSIKIVKQ